MTEVFVNCLLTDLPMFQIHCLTCLYFAICHLMSHFPILIHLHCHCFHCWICHCHQVHFVHHLHFHHCCCQCFHFCFHCCFHHPHCPLLKTQNGKNKNQIWEFVSLEPQCIHWCCWSFKSAWEWQWVGHHGWFYAQWKCGKVHDCVAHCGEGGDIMWWNCKELMQ